MVLAILLIASHPITHLRRAILPDITKVSFLGMGIMGSAMAFNLLKNGQTAAVWNRSQSRASLAELAGAGAAVKAGLEDCVADADIVFTCLGDEQDVISRLTGPTDSVLAFARKGALVVDFSTIGPAAARTVNASLAAAGLRFLDAPVTGGDVGAKNGTLTIMVGGAEADFAEALPFLEMMGKNIRYCGPSGAGQALKLCNQVLCAVNMVSVCEAFALADRLDLDRNLVVDVLQSGAGGSWALANLGKRILQDDLKPAFSLRNMLKDLRLVFDSINLDDDDISNRQSLPGTALSVELFGAVAAENEQAPDAFGTQAMIRAYDQQKAKNLTASGFANTSEELSKR
ncbi:MAG: NAD(P)-dependent oxidoreductase [Cyanobacteria bacterium SZAS LIN-3]|nr:NAD(P)-dependent oxidoreductase [Cyanobacteria bacterium SZAS LIN-3]